MNAPHIAEKDEPRSRAASARYGIPCSTCHAKADEPCRSRGSFRVTDTHAARIAAATRVIPPEVDQP